MNKSRDKRNKNDITFKSQEVGRRYKKKYDDDHTHYRNYRKNVIRYYEPVVYQFSYENWLSRFLYTIQDIGINYPDYPTTIDIAKMQKFILALPKLVPCNTSLCKSYITNYIDREKDNLDAITNNKKYLYDFLKDFYSDIKQKFGNELHDDGYYQGL